MSIPQPKRVEMPDGTARTYQVDTLDELKAQVADAIGVEHDEVALISEEGTPVNKRDDSIPASMRVIPKPKWG